MSAEIDDLIAKKTERLMAIERDAEIVRAEIAALEAARDAVASSAAVREQYQAMALGGVRGR